MQKEWKSIKIYEHPAKARSGNMGHVMMSTSGVYCLAVGSKTIHCPQAWAEGIRKEEGGEKQSAIIIRNVPESIRRKLKASAASQGKSMQGLVLELITQHVK